MKSILILAAVALCANAAPTDPASAVVETTNSGQRLELYQGDMVLDEFQKANLNKSTIDKRKAIGGNNYRWPNATVTYKIDASSEPDRAVIERAIQHWQDTTCLVFDEVTGRFRRPHAIFMKQTGCWALVGFRKFSFGQPISIGEGCNDTGTVVHEIGHALGFHHEQARPDRDEHVVVLEDNISEGMADEFGVETNTDYYGVPYDLGSIMHYGTDFFSIDDKNTLVTKSLWDQFLMGHHDRLSFWDIKLANLMYNCSGTCGELLNCTNGGYVDKNCRCVCPPGFTGETCSGGQASWERMWTCGDTIQRSPYVIRSPNYPLNYPADAKCIWNIRAPRGSRISAEFTDFHLSNRRRDNDERLRCGYDVFELRALDNPYDGIKYCARELHGQTKISATRSMAILFYASKPQKGFEINITFIP